MLAILTWNRGFSLFLTDVKWLPVVVYINILMEIVLMRCLDSMILSVLLHWCYRFTAKLARCNHILLYITYNSNRFFSRHSQFWNSLRISFDTTKNLQLLISRDLFFYCPFFTKVLSLSITSSNHFRPCDIINLHVSERIKICRSMMSLLIICLLIICLVAYSFLPNAENVWEFFIM